MHWLFTSDLHGVHDRYAQLFAAIRERRPSAVLLGGDLLPNLNWSSCVGPGQEDFVSFYRRRNLERLRAQLGDAYPRILLILGNEDPRFSEASFLALAATGLVEYVHKRRVELDGYAVYGYAFVPPTPFSLKDWERYDVSHYVEPGCLSPEQGIRSIPVPDHEARTATIARDLAELARIEDLSKVIFLFHSPPYHTALDRASLDGKLVDSVPVDVHVGSIAIRRFIEARQPLATLHGHIHEAARLTGTFIDRIGRTVCLGGAHDGPQLSLVAFDPRCPENATRELL